MSTDTGEPSLWYQPPAGARSPAWPQNPLLGTVAPSTGNPGSYPARLGETEDAAPTFYYPDVLSAVPATLDDDVVRELSDGLSPLGMSLSRGPAFRAGSEVTLMLTAAPGTTDAPDAWQALQQLRALRGTPPLGPAASAAVDGLALRRLYMTGMPAKEGHGGADRAAVTLFAAPPARADASRVPGGRRPVVAVIDSGVGHHPWLTGADGDPFWIDAGTHGWTDVPPGPATNESDGDVSPADGKLDTHAGHGTFIAGLVRQLAPDAQVLSMYAMSGSGVLDETVVLDALAWLLARVRAAGTDTSTGATTGGDSGTDADTAAGTAGFVDIVNLSFGYYEHAAADNRYTRELRQVLGDLGSLGVQVVASAGNDASTRPVFPAAFADPRFGAVPAIRLISVGALNPDGSHALYSNVDPEWAQHWEPGTAITSTTPPFGTSPGPVSVAYNPDDLVGGFAQWSGTSFAAGVASARLARALSDGAADHDLVDVSPAAACQRILRARRAVGVDAGDEVV